MPIRRSHAGLKLDSLGRDRAVAVRPEQTVGREIADGVVGDGEHGRRRGRRRRGDSSHKAVNACAKGRQVLDHVVVNEFCIIAAGAIVLENTVCESGFLYAGIPARKIKPITEEQRELLSSLPGRYVMYSSWFKEE